LLDAGDADTATWALIDTLGQIRCGEATPVLISVVAGNAASPVRREHAATALGVIGDRSAVEPLDQVLRDPRIERLVVVQGGTVELANAAASALGRLGEAGVLALCADVEIGGDVAGRAIGALRTVERDAPGGTAARATLDAFDARADAADQAQKAEREALRATEIARRRDSFPHAAALADRLGHPEWLTDQGVLRPDSFNGALDKCHSLGLSVEEHEEDVDGDMSDRWATVTVDGAQVTLIGGRGPRDVLY